MTSPEPSLGLFTDQYELMMAQAYWQNGMTDLGTFSLFFRKYPANRSYFVFMGLADVLEYLETFRFLPGDINFLRSLRRFDEAFLEYLGNLRFTGRVRAMPEGTIFFINEPVIEVTAPVLEAQLLETFIVNQANMQSILATKAARVIHAARGKQVIDFAARRTHGLEAANKMARVAYLAGFHGTSNVLAGALYGIPTFGTMAHSFVTACASEIESFRIFARSFPDASTLLVDTYDSLEGTKKAIRVGQEMKRQGHRLLGIRLDSGDLLDLARKTRALLDEAGFPEVQIIASGGLDEFEVEALRRADAPIDVFAVGTKVGVSADAPMTDCAYKLVAYGGRPVLKLSPQKQPLPGPKQVFRFRDREGHYQRDVIGCLDEPIIEAKGILQEVMKDGKRLQSVTSLEKLRQCFRVEFAALPEPYKALISPQVYDVTISEKLEQLGQVVIEEARKRELGGKASGDQDPRSGRG